MKTNANIHDRGHSHFNCLKWANMKKANVEHTTNRINENNIYKRTENQVNYLRRAFPNIKSIINILKCAQMCLKSIMVRF